MSAWGPHERAGVGTVRASAVRAVCAHPAGVHGPGGCVRACVRGDPAGTHTGRHGDPVGTDTGVRGDPAGTGVRGSSGHRWACDDLASMNDGVVILRASKRSV